MATAARPLRSTHRINGRQGDSTMPRRKRSRWGSITTVSRRKHIIRWTEDSPTGRVRKSHTFYGTRAEAELWRDRKHVEVSDMAETPHLTIGKAYEEWFLPSIDQRLADGDMAKNTYIAYVRNWDGITRGRWAKVPVGEIKPLEVQQWIDTLTRGGATQSLKLLRKVLDLCVKYEAVESNKFRIDYSLPKANSRDKRVLSLAEADALFRKLRGCACEAPFILACFGGARTAEALAVGSGIESVTADGIRFAVAKVERQATERDGKLSSRLKTKESRRAMLVPPPYGDRLLEIAGERRGCELLADRGDGIAFGRQSFRLRWIAESGAPVPFSNLRPSWRTIAHYEWHLEYETAEMLMGHAVEGTTGRHYLRPSIEDLAASFAASLKMST